jgi:hypothetical protein|tara:strand:- start:711 stop:977 length:267 start_codon:yes stop_codon:yes gene_type:complete
VRLACELVGESVGDVVLDAARAERVGELDVRHPRKVIDVAQVRELSEKAAPDSVFDPSEAKERHERTVRDYGFHGTTPACGGHTTSRL